MNTAALKTTWNTSMQVASGLGFGLALKVLQCDPQEEYTKLKNLIDPYYQVLRDHKKVEDHRNLIGRVASIIDKDTDDLIKKIKWEIRYFNDDDLKTFDKIYNFYLIYIRVLQAGFRTLPAWDTSVRVCRLIEQAGCQIPYSSFLIAGTCITSFGLTFFCTQENLKPWQKKTVRWIRSHSYTLHFTVRVIYSIALIREKKKRISIDILKKSPSQVVFSFSSL